MASTRKSRKVNKRYAKINEGWPDKDGTNATPNSTRKRKLSDLLGSQWSKEELERFYEGYRKYGKEWKKVAGKIRNRSIEMVETLYNMNKAYLSLPEGTATVAGLIAMMTDHYNNMEGSGSERESNDVSRTSRKPQKRGGGKSRVMSKATDDRHPDPRQYQSSPTGYGCLSLLKGKHSGDLFAGSIPRVVGKRTPRIPVPNMSGRCDRNITASPNSQVLRSSVNAADDEGAHVAALALAEASQRGGSPQVSQTPDKRAEHVGASPVHSGGKKNFEEMVNSKIIGSHMDMEGSLGSREAENGDFARDAESVGAFEGHPRAKKLRGKGPKSLPNESDHFDDDREACSGTEGLARRKVKDEIDMEITYGKTRTAKSSKKRSRQLFFDDDSPTFDALQTLADLSVNIMFPASTVDSESSVQVRDENKSADYNDKDTVPESLAINHQDKPILLEEKERGHSTFIMTDVHTRKNARRANLVSHEGDAPEMKQQTSKSISKVPKKERKVLLGKVLVEGKRSSSKIKRGSQGSPLSKLAKLNKQQEQPSSTDLGKLEVDVIGTTRDESRENQDVMPMKSGSRRKMNLFNAFILKESKSNDISQDDGTERCLYSVNNKAAYFKNKLSLCLSSQLLRRWCIYEWFYSSIDYPWYARNEFEDYLKYVSLGHIPRLTRVEWDVIRSSLGRPRRLSENFLQEEREKLQQYRESVRTHYVELRIGVREGLPTDLARPLSVGQRVIAWHPKTREIHDGSILTVDRNRCRVQFDRPELGVEFVMDVDCMPLSPGENMPEALRRKNDITNKFCNGLSDLKADDQHKEWIIGGLVKFASNENLGIANGNSLNDSNFPMNDLMKHAKGDTIDAVVQAKAVVSGVTVAAQHAMFTQPCTLAQIQAKEADIRALAELARSLDKKEALLLELRHMNEVSETQNNGDLIKDLELFRKQYATVLLQLHDVNDQVSSCLFNLRQRNTYCANPTPIWRRPIENSGGPAGTSGISDSSVSLDHDPAFHVKEVINSSRRIAMTMVDSAVKAIRFLEEGEDAFVRIGEALDCTNEWKSRSDPGISAARFARDPGHCSSTNEDHTPSCRSEAVTIHAVSPKPSIACDANEVQFPLELISSCVATLYMIQTCSERQYPPAEVAQILDSAVSSLQPSCPQNFPIYREIETCMGIIKNQMLALIPTPAEPPVV